jgi:hypothetical protein
VGERVAGGGDGAALPVERDARAAAAPAAASAARAAPADPALAARADLAGALVPAGSTEPAGPAVAAVTAVAAAPAVPCGQDRVGHHGTRGVDEEDGERPAATGSRSSTGAAAAAVTALAAAVPAAVVDGDTDLTAAPTASAATRAVGAVLAASAAVGLPQPGNDAAARAPAAVPHEPARLAGTARASGLARVPDRTCRATRTAARPGAVLSANGAPAGDALPAAFAAFAAFPADACPGWAAAATGERTVAGTEAAGVAVGARGTVTAPGAGAAVIAGARGGDDPLEPQARAVHGPQPVRASSR